MKNVGIVGWRGMVGSVLMERMREEGDFQSSTFSFFSTSQAGQAGPEVDGTTYELLDAHDLETCRKNNQPHDKLGNILDCVFA